ncbi:unnamed protein product [Phaedon cochleariae]|uniref:Peptidase S1 domain-containing protein n=1 Tax=Phaedon cochleariae TaxID=80249 RepID=A0A9P0DIU7_PHACE|nr:unnamed protein product [Phaedon cochleariae]
MLAGTDAGYTGAIISLFFLTMMTRAVSQSLESPCPDIFNYRYDRQGNLYGEVQIKGARSDTLQLNVELSIGNIIEHDYNGNIELTQPKEQVLQDMLNFEPVVYKVQFPMWRVIPPKITKIKVDGSLICSGPPRIPTNLVPVITTVNLFHTIKVDISPLMSFTNSPPENSIFYEEEAPSSDSDGAVRRVQGGQLGGRGKPPPPKRNRFRFNPVAPPDPTKIYRGNPFLGTPSVDHYRPGGIFGQLDEMPYRFNPTSTQPPIQEEEQSDSSYEVSHRKDDFSPAHPGTNFSPQQIVPKDNVPPNKNRGPYGDICGRPILTNSLISNGDAVPRGAFPWLGALYRSKPSGFLYICSASLISDRHVVTAAHCVKNQDSKVLKPQELVVILGKLNLQRWGRYAEGEKMIEPESVSVHPDHKDSSADADIAVLVLSETVQFSKYVLPLCLWVENTDLRNIVGTEGIVVGWGKDLNGVLMTNEPKQTKLPIVSQEICLRSSYEFLHVTSNRTFCAGFRNGNGPCNGDSGSGFIINRNGRWTLRGVVSMSLKDINTRSCDLSNYVVFTDASKYLDWLISFIK